METNKEIDRRSVTPFEEDMNEFGVPKFETIYMNQDENAVEMTNDEDSDLLFDQYGEVVDTLNPDDEIYAEIPEIEE